MTLQQIVTLVQQTACTVHGPPGKPCPGCGACSRRVARARASHLIPFDGLAAFIGLAGNTTGTVLDPEVKR